MKSITLKIVTLLIFSISFLSCGQSTKENKEAEPMEAIQKRVVSLISPEDLNNLKDIQLIDVRTPEEFDEGHLNNAMNIDYYDDNFMNDMSSKLDKSKPIYIYCKSGGRSGKASKKLKQQGFIKVYDLQGGIINWKENNLEVEK
jgi:rhodanese-related sulfurtransferase